MATPRSVAMGFCWGKGIPAPFSIGLRLPEKRDGLGKDAGFVMGIGVAGPSIIPWPWDLRGPHPPSVGAGAPNPGRVTSPPGEGIGGMAPGFPPKSPPGAPPSRSWSGAGRTCPAEAGTPPPWGSTTNAGGEIGSIKEDPGRPAPGLPRSKAPGRQGAELRLGHLRRDVHGREGRRIRRTRPRAGEPESFSIRRRGISKEEPWERVAVDFKGVGSGMKDPKAVGLRGGGVAWARAASACGVSVFFAGGGRLRRGKSFQPGGSSSNIKHWEVIPPHFFNHRLLIGFFLY